MRLILTLSAVISAAALAQGADDPIALARKRWSESPHGPMLERILPPTFESRQLPAATSRDKRSIRPGQ